MRSHGPRRPPPWNGPTPADEFAPGPRRADEPDVLESFSWWRQCFIEKPQVALSRNRSSIHERARTRAFAGEGKDHAVNGRAR